MSDILHIDDLLEYLGYEDLCDETLFDAQLELNRRLRHRHMMTAEFTWYPGGSAFDPQDPEDIKSVTFGTQSDCAVQFKVELTFPMTSSDMNTALDQLSRVSNFSSYYAAVRGEKKRLKLKNPANSITSSVLAAWGEHGVWFDFGWTVTEEDANEIARAMYRHNAWRHRAVSSGGRTVFIQPHAQTIIFADPDKEFIYQIDLSAGRPCIFDTSYAADWIALAEFLANPCQETPNE